MSNEKKPPSKLKPYDHVHVREAIKQGWRAEGFAPESQPSRRARAARAIVSAVRLNPTLREVQRAERAWKEARAAEFAQVKASARGANVRLLNLIARSDEVPTNRPENVQVDERGKTHIADAQNADAQQWSRVGYRRDFIVNPSNFSDGKPGAGRLFTSDKKPLTITVSAAEGHQLRIPVERMSVHYDASNVIAQDGTSVPGAGSATVIINERPYNIEETRLYTSRGVDTRINEDTSMDGQVRFTLNEDGILNEVYLGRSNRDTMQLSPGSSVDVPAFINNLDYLVFDNQVQLPDDLSGLQ